MGFPCQGRSPGRSSGLPLLGKPIVRILKGEPARTRGRLRPIMGVALRLATRPEASKDRATDFERVHEANPAVESEALPRTAGAAGLAEAGAVLRSPLLGRRPRTLPAVFGRLDPALRMRPLLAGHWGSLLNPPCFLWRVQSLR